MRCCLHAVPVSLAPISGAKSSLLESRLLSNSSTASCTGRNGTKAAAAAAATAASSTADETSNGQPTNRCDPAAVPPASPKRGKPKKHLPAVHGAISYLRWRSKYVREYKGGLYVAYNGKHHETPYNAVTVSEVQFHCIAVLCIYLQSVPSGEDQTERPPSPTSWYQVPRRKHQQLGCWIASADLSELKVPTHWNVQATGYGLLISVLQRERGDFDGFLRFWRRFLTPKGLMYWQLVRGGDGEVSLQMHFESSTFL